MGFACAFCSSGGAKSVFEILFNLALHCDADRTASRDRSQPLKCAAHGIRAALVICYTWISSRLKRAVAHTTAPAAKFASGVSYAVLNFNGAVKFSSDSTHIRETRIVKFQLKRRELLNLSTCLPVL